MIRKSHPFVRLALSSIIIASLVEDCEGGTATANLTVNITITAGCTVTGGTLSFGSQSVLTTDTDQTTTIGVNCTNTTPYNIGLDKGTYGSSVTARSMKGGASSSEYINYTLFSNAGRTTNWGNTVGTDTVPGTGIGTTQNLTVYGRVPAQTTGSPGNYSDTVTITVTY